MAWLGFARKSPSFTIAVVAEDHRRLGRGMRETIKVIITAVETVRLERVIEIPRERYAQYQEMIECGTDEMELTLAFGDLLRESPDVADSLGFEYLKITPAPRAPLEAGVSPMAHHWDGLTDIPTELYSRGLARLDEPIERSAAAVKSSRALIERSVVVVMSSQTLIKQTTYN